MELSDTENGSQTGLRCVLLMRELAHSPDMNEVKIVKPQKEHFSEILSLLRQLWKDKRLNERRLGEVFENGLSSSFQEFRIAICNDRIVGFASLTVRNSLWQEGYLGHIDELVVDEKFRGKGVGTRLLDKMIKVSKERSCRKIELDSAFHRKKAHIFYESKGFENRDSFSQKTSGLH